ncbi:histidine ammonia-lyase [Fimbriimonas ginsengisoli]|uniref:Histidine ammonia-lyase n=1 Tax=Fimbriimonas ginsengisoli Gsoil 348 TaxID=661478 RepID=A0A068NT98_FIMGI|nr:histidine ammonia-lyase [Fimbriimonas ginsengisoli]AIE86778.1 histidine ammonia-lyase [Fimbriimonas ginsengisoli Gsoil 348]
MMVQLAGQSLVLEAIEAVSRNGQQVGLTDDAVSRMSASRQAVEKIVSDRVPVYGISTGFGRLCDVSIPLPQLEQLQLNLVRSHCCGLGEPLSEPETRAMMLLRANVLALGYSGARPAVAQALCDLLNHRITPHVPSKGSVGASGDLAPLAHVAQCLIGEGWCRHEGVRKPAAEALSAAGLSPLKLGPKEGLSLINGTQALTAVGALMTLRAERLVRLADAVGAMTVEALAGVHAAFDSRIHSARPHPGQGESAAQLRAMLEESEIMPWRTERNSRVQDAYSLRCMPQVHGAVRGVINHVRSIVEIETGSATDNPLVFDDGTVVSGGNFHGAPLAMAYDYAAIALTDLVGISERRVERMINPDLSEGLPPFLSPEAGLGSGFMIAHVTVVALLNEMKVLSSPASIDNLPTSAGTEDHVSMGMTAALKLRTIVENAERCLAIELIAAAEGLEYRMPLQPGTGVLAMYRKLREMVPPLMADRALSEDIERVASEIAAGSFTDSIPVVVPGDGIDRRRGDGDRREKSLV